MVMPTLERPRGRRSHDLVSYGATQVEPAYFTSTGGGGRVSPRTPHAFDTGPKQGNPKQGVVTVNGIVQVPDPGNEPVLNYAPGSAERASHISVADAAMLSR